MKKYLVSIEVLHLIAGFSLVLSGVFVYFISGLEMMLSWAIFGAMYISMSDIGENEMSEDKKNHNKHKLRRIFAYVGAGLSVFLVLYYISNLI
jgi:hypothetical protein